ncbi:uncharacterized protein LOC118433218 isoform X2 [Folsomia candida]|uniref:uncharacterized protein LOC118433218 isoform X2 n=1 Tax=Folsomia candida TaxID=158441 RepID=UPI001604C2A4|nr:uncharacterized protein LOC118433218 isoform X2 [Folsomia candida]
MEDDPYTITNRNVGLTDDEIFKIPLMHSDPSSHLQTTIKSKLAQTIANITDAAKYYTQICDYVRLRQDKITSLNTKYQACVSGNSTLYDIYKAFIAEIVNEHGADSNIGIILHAMKEADWKGGSDTIVAIKWHEIPGLKEILTPKLPVDCRTADVPKPSAKLPETTSDLGPLPLKHCSVLTNDSVVWKAIPSMGHYADESNSLPGIEEIKEIGIVNRTPPPIKQICYSPGIETQPEEWTESPSGPLMGSVVLSRNPPANMTNGTPEMEGSNRNTSDQFEPLRSEDSGPPNIT